MICAVDEEAKEFPALTANELESALLGESDGPQTTEMFNRHVVKGFDLISIMGFKVLALGIECENFIETVGFFQVQVSIGMHLARIDKQREDCRPCRSLVGSMSLEMSIVIVAYQDTQNHEDCSFSYNLLPSRP